MQALAYEEIELAELTQVIERFPTIVGRLIALANSAWSAPVGTISSLEMACARLGFSVVRSTSIALTISSPFDPGRCPGFDPERFWSSALLAADTAAWLAPCARTEQVPEPSTARAAGILHNLGLLWIADQLPDEFDQAVAQTRQTDGVSLRSALSGVLGFNDTHAGALIGDAWGLPAQLTVAIAHHADADYQGSQWQSAALIGVAASMVASIQYGREWQAPHRCLQRLAIAPADAERITQQLGAQRKRVVELAKTLFTG
jgi:HD-like signal output (HDOD) protein